MTTIAYRGGVMAGDTAMTDRGTYCGEYQKVFAHAGMLMGACGCLGEVARLRDWFNAGAVGDPPAFADNESEAILVDAAGRVEWVGHPSKRIEMDGEFFAIGSGFKLALGAMSAGASAERAVEIACDLDIYTARPINVLRLGQP